MLSEKMASSTGGFAAFGPLTLPARHLKVLSSQHGALGSTLNRNSQVNCVCVVIGWKITVERSNMFIDFA